MKSIKNPYLLLTPGPLSTTSTVKQTMLRDWCTWDDDYNNIVQEIRTELLDISGVGSQYTSVLMQGSGTFSVEAVVNSLLSEDDKLLVLANGVYGQRIATIAEYHHINCQVYDAGDLERHELSVLDEMLEKDNSITHVAVVHCETTTGMINNIEEIGAVVKKHNKVFVVDAMSSFGGIPIDVEKLGIDCIISSSNKCVQGVPGFGFAILKKSIIENAKGNARSLSLDLYAQWDTMEKYNGKWRFTSPTHVVRAFRQALKELEEEGGVEMRNKRYTENQKLLVRGMKELGFETLLAEELHSPIITTFLSPNNTDFDFIRFYEELKQRGFVIYPGKVTEYQCFRIGNIGEVHAVDIENLLSAIAASMYWNE